VLAQYKFAKLCVLCVFTKLRIIKNFVFSVVKFQSNLKVNPKLCELCLFTKLSKVKKLCVLCGKNLKVLSQKYYLKVLSQSIIYDQSVLIAYRLQTESGIPKVPAMPIPNSSLRHHNQYIHIDNQPVLNHLRQLLHPLQNIQQV
jgi:hypothetical protein